MAEYLNGRVVDIDAYERNGSLRFAAIIVPDTGVDAKTWWWTYDKTSEQIGQMLQLNQARPLDLQSYTVNGVTKYAAVMIRNTGADGKA